jgi:hypothetical protein
VTLVKIHEQRAITDPTPEGKIVHAQCVQVSGDLAVAVDARDACSTDESQERIPAGPVGAKPQLSRKSPSSLAAQGEAHRFEAALQRWRAPLIERSQIREPLAEGLTRTSRIQAAKPSRVQPYTDWRVTQREIGQHTHEAAMRPMRPVLAIWAPRGSARGGEVNDDLTLWMRERVETQCRPLWSDSGKQ